MKSTTHSLKTVGMLATALTLALFANVAYGQWTNPPASPPSGNVAPPINESSTAQTKNGMLTTSVSRAANRVQSDRYCDYAGGNCFRPTDVSGGSAPAGMLCGQASSWGPGVGVPDRSCIGHNPYFSCPSGYQRTKTHHTKIMGLVFSCIKR